MGKAVDRRLYGALRHVRRRILLRHFIRCIMLGLIVALAQTAIWMGVSFFIPILYMWHKSAVCGIGATLISMAAGAVFRPSMKDVAHEADRQGLQERVITAYERMGLSDAFSVVQREDAIHRLKGFDVRTISVMPPKKWMYGAAVIALLILIGSMLPNPQRDIVNRQIRVQKEIEEQVEKLQDKAQDNLAGEIDLTEEEKQELMKLVSQLARTLRQTRNYREALKEISKAEQKLTDLVKQFQRPRMALLGEELERHPLISALGQAIKAMDAQGIRNELETLKKRLEQGDMDEETMESFRKALEDTAKALPEGSLKQQLENAASALASGIADESGDAKKGLDSLQEMLVDMAQGNMANVYADIRYLLQNMKSSIASAAGQDIRLVQNGNYDNNNDRSVDGSNQGSQTAGDGQGSAGDSSNGGAQGSGSQSGGGQTSGRQASNGHGSGSHNGSGGGSGSGSGKDSQGSGGLGSTSGGQGSGNSGQGSSSGGAGAGVGSGQTNQDAGYQEGGSSTGYGQKGQGDPDSYGNYERIYDPTRLGDGGEISQVAGNPMGQGTGEQVEAGPGTGSFGGFIPYNEVFGSYSRQAMENLERMAIPPGMRQLIKEYFSSLE